MSAQVRLGQQARQEVREDVGFRRARIASGWGGEAVAAFQMLEADLDAPAQTVEIADDDSWELRRPQRGDQDRPFGRDDGAGLEDGPTASGLGDDFFDALFRGFGRLAQGDSGIWWRSSPNA